MICHIDAGNGLPIYSQIERQVKFAVANGSLLVGERVPSVRELATQTAVNVNTVARAYRELQPAGRPGFHPWYGIGGCSRCPRQVCSPAPEHDS